jgi:hypothetical protein
MAARVPARLTAADGRKFGVTVGTAFLLFGAIAYWRGKHRTAMVLSGLGALLLVAGIAVPTSLGPVERAWMGLALLISKVTTPLFMGIVYFIVLMPIGLVRRLSGKSPIVPPTRAASRWEPHTPAVAVGESMERQF